MAESPHVLVLAKKWREYADAEEAQEALETDRVLQAVLRQAVKRRRQCADELEAMVRTIGPAQPPEEKGEAVKLSLHRCIVCGTRWLLWPSGRHGGGWNLLDAHQRPGSCCDNVPMGDQIEYLRDFDLGAGEVQGAPPAPGWQPIETAPRDGIPFWAYALELVDLDFNPSGIVEACFDGEQFIGAIWDGCYDIWRTAVINLTHWMPLPAPPASGPTGAATEPGESR